MKWYQGKFERIHELIGQDLVSSSHRVEVPTWHAQDVRGVEHLVSYELAQVSLECPIPSTPQDAVLDVEPQMPWAEEHFAERVSGKPLNPPPSAERWQTAGVADKHRTIQEPGPEGSPVMKYSHTYPERFWPKKAGPILDYEGRESYRFQGRAVNIPHYGIRFKYGDLGDVRDLLVSEPLTRQAYLPVWFPEDTGAVHKERVPCSLGYHFLIRAGQLNVTYMIRSVDFVRHFRDDVYLAMRLAQWMVGQINEHFNVTAEDPNPNELRMGNLVMHVMSLHYFQGDLDRMERAYGNLATTQ